MGRKTGFGVGETGFAFLRNRFQLLQKPVWKGKQNRFAFAQNRFGKAVQNRFQLKPVSMKPVYDETGSSRAPRNRPKPNLTGAFVYYMGF